MKEEKRFRLLLAFQKALLFNITINTRLVFAEVKDSGKLIISVYMDRMPTEDEKDVYFSVSSEITGEFIELSDSTSEVYFSTDGFDDESLTGKMVLFARCDYLDVNGNIK